MKKQKTHVTGLTSRGKHVSPESAYRFGRNVSIAAAALAGFGLVVTGGHTASHLKAPPHAVEISDKVKPKTHEIVDKVFDGTDALNQSIDDGRVGVQESTATLFQPGTIFYSFPSTEQTWDGISNIEFTLDHKMGVNGLVVLTDPDPNPDQLGMQAVTMLIDGQPKLMFTQYNAADKIPVIVQNAEQGFGFGSQYEHQQENEVSPHLTVEGAFMFASPVTSLDQTMGTEFPVGIGMPTN